MILSRMPFFCTGGLSLRVSSAADILDEKGQERSAKSISPVQTEGEILHSRTQTSCTDSVPLCPQPTSRHLDAARTSWRGASCSDRRGTPTPSCSPPSLLRFASRSPVSGGAARRRGQPFGRRTRRPSASVTRWARWTPRWMRSGHWKRRPRGLLERPRARFWTIWHFWLGEELVICYHYMTTQPCSRCVRMRCTPPS